MDCYTRLKLPQTASIDPEILQAAYLEQSKLHHPDHGGDPQVAAFIHEAYEILKAPEKRIKHLISLQNDPDLSAWRTVQMKEDLMTLFSRVGALTQQTKSQLDKVLNAKGAIGRAVLTPQLLQTQQQLEGLNEQLDVALNGMQKQLCAWDSLPEKTSSDWQSLATFQAEFAYLQRWQSQVKAMLLDVMTALL